MRSKNRKTRPPAALLEPEPPAAQQIPDWVNHMPEVTAFFLHTWFPDVPEKEQEIELTREEFVALKAALAKMRGYTTKGETSAT